MILIIPKSRTLVISRGERGEKNQEGTYRGFSYSCNFLRLGDGCLGILYITVFAVSYAWNISFFKTLYLGDKRGKYPEKESRSETEI